MKLFSRCLFIAFLGVSLAACNGGDDGGFSAGSGSAGAPAPGGGTAGAGRVQLGSGTADQFQAGTLKVGVAKLSAGGTTTIRATLVNSDGTPYTGDAEVSFISNCVQQGLAKIESPVTATNGAATSTYTATGCSGTDTITAKVTVGDTQLTATGVVDVAQAELGSIAFISADPDTISFHGSGLTETSTVTFQVLDDTGSPMANEKVDFALSTDVGGIKLSQTSATSGADGKVSTVVQAGTIPTPVRIKATVANTGTSTQSSVLTISTSIPDDNSFSISVETLNPEAFNYDGVTDEITVHLADRFNNPVLDGTAVTFVAEGGSIVSHCETEGGTCSVDWTSQAPRPADGRVTILAYAIGEESFTDKNGDGVFSGTGKEPFIDRGEPFINANENYKDGKGDPCNPAASADCHAYHDPGEWFYDFNNDGHWTGPDGYYEGVQCKVNCGPNNKTADPGKYLNFTTGIGARIVLVMSGSLPIACTYQVSGTGTPPAVCLPSSVQPAFCPDPPDPAVCAKGTAVTLDASGSADFYLYITDPRYQTLAAGTTISLEGENVKVLNESPILVPNTNAFPAGQFHIRVTSDPASTDTKGVNVTVKTAGPGTTGQSGTTRTFFVPLAP